jgi:predicted acylesterase/phospholipase RssA
MPILQHLARISHGSIYKSQQMYEFLKRELGRDLFYGGKRYGDARNKTRVAVTAADKEGRRPILIANYNTEGSVNFDRGPNAIYEFRRPSIPAQELRFWEAAAATCAAPRYFKPFFHGSSHRYFLDGALYNSNPATIAHHERRFIWPDVADRAPDIFLSIGTGQNREGVPSEMTRNRGGDKTETL